MYYEWVYNGLPLVIYLIKMILGGFDHRQNVFFGIYTKYLSTISKTLHMDATHNPLFFPELSLHGQFKSEKGGGDGTVWGSISIPSNFGCPRVWSDAS